MELVSEDPTTHNCTYQVKVDGVNHSVISTHPGTTVPLTKLDQNMPWVISALRQTIG